MPKGAALLLVDVINGFDFKGSEGIVRAAKRAAPHIARLAERAREHRVPVIYVNDNFGKWRSDFRATVSACSDPKMPGHEVTKLLVPASEDFFVLKPSHSGFHSTPLEMLLDDLGAGTLILTGFAANLCVLFTANDAHMHGYRLIVPRDCTASNRPELTRATLTHLREGLSARTPLARDIDFGRLKTAVKKPRRSTGTSRARS